MCTATFHTHRQSPWKLKPHPVKPRRRWMWQILLTGWDANSCSLSILSWWDRHRLLWATSSHLGQRKNKSWICIIMDYTALCLQGCKRMWRIMVFSEETHTCMREHASSTGTEQSWNQTPDLCANLQTWTAHFHLYFWGVGIVGSGGKWTRRQMFKYGASGCLFLHSIPCSLSASETQLAPLNWTFLWLKMLVKTESVISAKRVDCKFTAHHV